MESWYPIIRKFIRLIVEKYRHAKEIVKKKSIFEIEYIDIHDAHFNKGL